MENSEQVSVEAQSPCVWMHRWPLEQLQLQVSKLHFYFNLVTFEFRRLASFRSAVIRRWSWVQHTPPKDSSTVNKPGVSDAPNLPSPNQINKPQCLTMCLTISHSIFFSAQQILKQVIVSRHNATFKLSLSVMFKLIRDSSPEILH